MNALQQKQLYALDRIGHFLAKLEFATNPFEIEALVYTVMVTARSCYHDLHAFNSISTPERIQERIEQMIKEVREREGQP